MRPAPKTSGREVAAARSRGAGGTLLVVNPWATKVVADVRARATRILAADGLLDVVVTREKGHARRRILEAVEEGVRTVACLGGTACSPRSPTRWPSRT